MSRLKSGGGGIKNHYDMLIMVIVLIALLASGLYLVLRIGTERSNLNSGAEVTTPSSIHAAAAVDLSNQLNVLEGVRTPFQTEEREVKLMVSELRVRSVNKDQIPAPIPFSAKTCPYSGEEQPDIDAFDRDLDGMPDEYEKKYGFDPGNPDDADDDMDGDGFSNLEEYIQGKDPTDKTISPSILAKIRLFRTKTIPFMMKFYGVQKLSEDNLRYQLNLRSLDKTHFATMGDVIEGYKLVDFQADVVTNGAKIVDRSRLVIEKAGKRETLVKGQLRNKSEQLLQLISLLDQEKFVTRLGETFNYRGKAFKVQDISSAGVTVLDVTEKESTIVRRLSPEEKMIMKNPTDQLEMMERDGMPTGMPGPRRTQR